MAKASKKVVLKNVRASFVKVFEPGPTFDGKGLQYSVQVLIPKDHPQIKQIQDAYKEVAQKAFPGVKPGALRLPLRDSDKEREDGKEKAGHPGMLFLNANASIKAKPQVIDRWGKVLDSDDDFYSGAWMNVSLAFYDFDKNNSKGIAVGLNNIQKWADDDRLDGRTSAFDDFEIDESDAPAADDEAPAAPVAATAESDDEPW